MKALRIWLWLVGCAVAHEDPWCIPDTSENSQLLAARALSEEQAEGLFPEIRQSGSTLREKVKELAMVEIFRKVRRDQQPVASLTFPLPLVQQAAAALGVAPVSPDPQRGYLRVKRLLRQGIVPNFKVKNLPLEDALERWVELPRRLDPTGEGIACSVEEHDKRENSGDAQVEHLITMDVRGIPLGHLLHYIAACGNVRYSISESGISILPGWPPATDILDLTTMSVR